MVFVGGVEYNVGPHLVRRRRPRGLLEEFVWWVGLVVAVMVFMWVGPLLMALLYLLMKMPWGLPDRIVAALLPAVMRSADNQQKKLKQELLKGLRGHVVDVGAGSGITLQYLTSPDIDQVTAVEPNVHLLPVLEKMGQTLCLPKLRVIGGVLSDVPEKADAIIFANVLCEVSDVRGTLNEAMGKLRPGGRLIFWEHTGYPGGWRLAIQRAFNHWWKVVSGGCNCDRDPVAALKSLPNLAEVQTWSWIGESPIPWVRPWAVAVAIKKQ